MTEHFEFGRCGQTESAFGSGQTETAIERGGRQDASIAGRDAGIAGYARKQDVLGSGAAPFPVFGDDLVTVVGQMVPGKGFIPAGVDPNSVPKIPVVAAPSGQGASDGSKVVFSTVQQLVNADTDATRDLYLYDFGQLAGQHLSLVSKGDVTPGSGADVKNLARMSQDGTHIYFVAGGVLSVRT